MFICLQSPMCSTRLLETHSYGLSLETMKWAWGLWICMFSSHGTATVKSTQVSYGEEAWWLPAV